MNKNKQQRLFQWLSNNQELLLSYNIDLDDMDYNTFSNMYNTFINWLKLSVPERYATRITFDVMSRIIKLWREHGTCI